MSGDIPASPRSETALICALLTEPSALDECEGLVTPPMFFVATNAALYSAIVATRKRGREVSPVTVSETLEVMGRLDLTEPMYASLSQFDGASVRDLASEVRAVHQRRELITACMSLSARGRDPLLDHRTFLADVEATISGIVNSIQAIGGGLRQINPDAAFHAILEAIRSKGRAGLSTTLRALDAITSGVGNGHVMILGGWPGTGKTGMAIQILEDCAMNRQLPAAFFSCEMPEADIAKRLLSKRSGVKLAAMRSGSITPEQINQMGPSRDEIRVCPIFIYDEAEPTISTIRAEARRLKARVGPLGVVVIDYLQLVRGVGRFDIREQEVASVSRGIKAMAKELDCPVIALAQLNAGETGKANPRPRAKDLRESRGIWNDADIVVLIYDPDKEKIEQGKAADEGNRDFIVDKNRHGPTGVAKVRFDKVTATFVNLDADAPPAWPSTTRGVPDHVGGDSTDSGDGEAWYP